MKMKVLFIDQTLRFALEIDEEDGGHFVSIPVRNAMVEYDEWYEVDRETFDSYVADPTRAHGFVAQATRRELDHLLLLKPGRDRGWAY